MVKHVRNLQLYEVNAGDSDDTDDGDYNGEDEDSHTEHEHDHGEDIRRGGGDTDDNTDDDSEDDFVPYIRPDRINGMERNRERVIEIFDS